MTVKDPPRLLDAGIDMPDALRKGLKAARGDVPRGDQLTRLAGRLPMGGAPPPGGNSSSPRGGGASPQGARGGGAPAPSLGPMTSLLPAAGIGAFLAIATLGLQALMTRPDPPPVPARNTTAAVAVAPRAAVAVGGSPDSEDRDRARPASPPPKAVTVTPLSATSAGTEASSGSAAPSGGEPAPDVTNRESEIELLQRAQDALRGAPAQALDLTNRHAVRFPGGALGQESEVIAIDALVRLGRVGEAQSRAAAFAARFPTSAHLPRIDALVHPAASSRASASHPGEIDSTSHKGSASAPPTP
jgi:hypothetical protein